MIDGKLYDLSERPYEPDENKDYRIEVLLDRLTVRSEIYLQIAKSVEAAAAALEDELMLQINIVPVTGTAGKNLFNRLGCPEHHYALCELQPYHFSFNTPVSACGICMGLGSSHIVEPRFLVISPHKSIMKGALHNALF